MVKICILDYGSGNVQSVFNMFKTFTDNAVVSNETSVIADSTHLVLPGVGSFGSAMEKIKKNISLEHLQNEVRVKKKPFLGICVGMQVLADQGFEFGTHAGLGWISGAVRQLNSHHLPLPHIGWNNLNIINHSPILPNVSSDMDFYFVHSFVFTPTNRSCIVASTDYGEPFCSIVADKNIIGVQFHPEKSQKAGRLLLQNFLNMGAV